LGVLPLLPIFLNLTARHEIEGLDYLVGVIQQLALEVGKVSRAVNMLQHQLPL